MTLSAPFALLVLGYLVLFVAYWQLFAARRPKTALAPVPVVERPPADDMFRVPDGLLFHPGHAWARPEGRDVVAVGIDDFARQLVGPVAGVGLPAVGARLEQGVAAMTLKANSKMVDVLSPVTGRVIAVNPEALGAPHAINGDPYGSGWLLQVEAARLGIDSRQLLSGAAARHWMSSSWEELSAMLSPELGTILHDGGMPLDGFARGIDHEHWDQVACRFLRSERLDAPR